MKRGIVFFLSLFLVLNLGAAFKEKDNTKKLKVTLGLGLSNIFERGTVNQYEAGSNIFPVTPSRKPSEFDLSLGYHLSHRLSLELMCDLISGGRVDRRNPANGDIVHAETFKQFMVTVNGDYQLLKRGRINFHVLGGAGINKQYDFFEGPYSTQLGNNVMLPLPNKTLFPAAHIGAGMIFAIDYRAGVKLDARYVKVFAADNPIDSFVVTFRFYVFLHWDGEYIVYD